MTRLLVLGGTLFLGRHIAEVAVASGHEVTLFHRGRTDPGAVPEAEHVHGDRERDLGRLAGRDFDWVIDTSAYVPRVVRAAVESISAGAYCFVSSVSAYADLRAPVTETTPLRAPEWASEDVDRHYGELKVACERVVAEAYGERALVIRPGLIVGPHDPTGRFSYWPQRIAAGGEVLAAGEPDRQVQFVDARDLAAWTLELLAAGACGALNAVSPPVTMRAVVDACLRVSGSGARVNWAPPDLLIAEGVGPWLEMPLWLSEPEWLGMMDVQPARVPARPLEETVGDIIAAGPATARKQGPAVSGVGLTAEREAALLDRLRGAPG